MNINIIVISIETSYNQVLDDLRYLWKNSIAKIFLYKFSTNFAMIYIVYILIIQAIIKIIYCYYWA